jgi:hypothetical protein
MKYTGSTWKYMGSIEKYQGSTTEVQGSTMEVQWKYKGVKWKYERSTRGVQTLYSLATPLALPLYSPYSHYTSL